MKNSKTKILAVANQKGGVAKTTSVINIGAGLALKGKNVLLVDMDNQAHLSRFLGYEKSDGKLTTSDLIWQTVSKNGYTIENAVRHSDTEQLDYIPSDHRLAGIISIIGTDNDSTTVLSRLFSESFFEKYDYIVIDCPAILDLLVSNILNACDQLPIPVQSEMWSYEAVEQILITMQRAKQTIDIKPYILGILVTMFNRRTNSSKSILEAVYNSYGEDMVLKTQIFSREEVRLMPIKKQSLVGKKNSVAGQQYMEVVEEIIRRAEQNNG